MVFHSPVFVLGFIPVALVCYFLTYRFFSTKGVVILLCALSLTFYSFWGLSFFLILLSSLMVNFGFYKCIITFKYMKNAYALKTTLLTSVVFNVCYLAYFKYLGFFSEIAQSALGVNLGLTSVLPVGISFYTFIQIGLLLNASRSLDQEKIGLADYFLFSSFFPYVTAGPIITIDEYEQSQRKTKLKPNLYRVGLGGLVFTFGLAKKILIADSLAPYVNEVYRANSFHEPIGLVTAVLGAVGYMLQLYYDFSGYVDMATGLALIFGIYLPLNFISPLKATNIIDFWRRWHITMTRFFTNYIYSPISLSSTRKSLITDRSGTVRFVRSIVFPIVFTFSCAGLWHGAGWNFLIFGVIHGVAIAICHIWRYAKAPKIPRFFTQFLTILVFCFSLIFFRTETPINAISFMMQNSFLQPELTLNLYALFFLVLLFLLMALVLPNTREVLANYKISYDEPPKEFLSKIKIRWKPSLFWVLATVLVGVVCLLLTANNSPFIYYKF